MNLSEFYRDNPFILQTVIGDQSGNYADIKDGGTWKALRTYVSNWPNSLSVNGPLTDIQLRASPVPVSGSLTLTPSGTQDVNIVSSVSLPITGPLTNAELRALALPISGSVSVLNFPATYPVTGTFWQATQPVSGPLTDTQLRTSPVSVSAASLPLPSGASTEATLALIKAKTDNLDVALSTRTKPADTQTISGSVSVSNFPASQVVTGPLTDTQLRASVVPVSIPLPIPVTDNSGSLTVDGTVAVSNFPASQPVTGPLTDAQLRATPVPISGTVTTSTSVFLISASLNPGWAVGTIGYYQTGAYGASSGLLSALTMTPRYKKMLMTDHGLKEVS